ncbi:MAG: lysoplasmalogenase [Desulfomonilaceae bacterium]
MVRVILLVAGALLTGLLWAENTGNHWLIFLFKTPFSCMFVLVALLQTHPMAVYYRLVLTGLILGLVRDVCLALPGDTAFQAGLVAFLGGHVLYTIAFARLTQRAGWAHLSNLLILAVSGYVFWWLMPHLGEMLIPVSIYIVIISVMVLGACAVFRNPDTKRAGAWAILLGALLFYVSDIFVARDKFIANEFLNRLLGLPLYYCGQFLLAFSVGLVRSAPGAFSYQGPKR